jgi:uncharacterized protein (DUF1501 family)
MDRRKFIQNTSLGLGLTAHLKVGQMDLSAFQPTQTFSENDNILVVVQLFGGNDGINTITPYEWDKYYNIFRPNLHIPEKVVIPISKELGMAMHPNLKKGPRDGMHGLFTAGKLSIMTGIGYHNPNFSHFRSTDIWLSGIVPTNDASPLKTGWMGRYFDQVSPGVVPTDPFCIQVGKSPSLMFMGEKNEKAIVLQNADDFYNQAKSVESNKLEASGGAFYKEEFAYINEIGLRVNSYSNVIKKAFDKGKNIESYTDKSLSNQLKLVARLIDGGLKTKVYFVELPGFDTHSNQGGLDGLHSRLLAEVSEAVSAFQSDIEKLGHAKRVLGITTSEFGRRPHENGSAGTDHGTSNFMFGFGENVKPELVAPHISFLPFMDHQNLNYVTDFRSIYFEIMVSWFGQSIGTAEKVLGSKFPYYNGTGFIKTSVPDKSLPPPPEVPKPDPNSSDPGNPLNPSNTILEKDKFVIFPNPVTEGGAYLNMTLFLPDNVRISQHSIDGKTIAELHKKNYRAGLFTVFLDLKGGPGPYLIKIVVGRRTHAIRILKIN